MPDDIQRTIYKLEIDDSGYIRGVESMSASTKKLTEQQEAANKALQTNQNALKTNGDFLQKAKKDLEDYTGTNQKYRQQLEKSFAGAQADQVKLTALVAENKKAYDAATLSAQNFATTAGKATVLQQQTTGGKIPVAPPPPLNQPGSLSNQIVSTLNIPEFAAASEAIAQTKTEFDGLRTAITLADERMKQLNATDEEFKLLAPIVAQGKDALLQYDKATQSTSEHTISFRSQLIAGKQALAAMTLAGKENTQEFRSQEVHVAELTHLYHVQQEELQILASRTRGLDFGKAAVESAISGFQIYSSVSILAGGASEELQKKTLQLFAAMQLLASLEQISLQLKKGGVIATNLQSAAQTVYTAVVGASTGALKAFRIALISTGIGAAAVLIGLLVKKYIDYRDAVKEAGEQQKLINEITVEANKESGKQIADLKILTQEARNANEPMKERLAAVKALQKEFPDYFGNLSTETILTGDITKATDELTASLIAAAKARAAKGKIDAIESQKLDLDFQKQKVINATTNEANRVKAPTTLITTGGGITGTTSGTPVEGASIEQQKEVIRRRRDAALKDIQDAVSKLDQQENFLTAFVGVDQIAKVIEKTDKDTKGGKGKEIENVFIKTLRDLLARLRNASKNELQSVDLIQKEFTDKLFDEIDKIDELVAKKQLTVKQGNLLTKILEKIIGKETDKTIADFKKKIETAINKLTTELNDIQNKANIDSINLLKDEFDRRAKLIDANEKKELEDSKQATTERLAALDLDRLLIGEKAYQDAKAIIISTGEQNALNIVGKFGQARQELAADIFKKSLDAFSEGLNSGLVARDEEIAKQIRSASDKFLQGKISFEQFQKDITKIQKDEEGIRRDATLANERAELAALDRHIKSIIDKTSKEYKDLIKLREQLAGTIANNEKEDAIKDAGDDTNKRKKDSLDAYVVATGQLADSVIGFWQAANDAESKALDRSIALQEKRVDAAQRIAARGNAEYLKLEQDRLTELNVKREAAARKQLGVDAALQASQVLVGITGAISKIATSPFGAETIEEIAVIIGALATGYGIVKSLQGNQPRLAEGTTFLKREKHPAGIDTIPAWLTEGEAVIPQSKNRNYKKSVEAIYHGKVPADVLNTFVENYVNKNYAITPVGDKGDKKLVTNISNQDIDNVNSYKNFITNISKIPPKVLSNFINNYQQNQFFRGTPDLKGASGTDQIPVMATRGEAIIPHEKNNLFKPVISAIFDGTIPAERINNFVKTYHSIKPVPQHNYEKIKEVSELHIGHDGKMAVALSEQNRLIMENNDLQRQTLRAMKSMSVSANIDRNGVAIMVNEFIEQQKIDKKS